MVLNDGLVKALSAIFLQRTGWQGWTPTVNQNGNVGVSIDFARYLVLGDLVILTAHISITGSGSAGNAIVVSGIPAAIQPADIGTLAARGACSVHDSGTNYYVGVVVAVGADDLRFRVEGGAGSVAGVSPSFALASGDDITFTATYER